MKTVIAILLTLILGVMGVVLGEKINLRELGSIISITIIGGFILFELTKKK